MVKEGLGEDFIKEVVRHIRAYDTYRTWEKRSDEEILKDFLKGDSKRSLSFAGHCETDPKVILRIHAFFKAVTSIIEKLSGFITSAVINIDGEGNGIVLIYAGRLILINKTIRDANRFRFKSLDHIRSEGEKLIEKALDLLEKYQEVAKI